MKMIVKKYKQVMLFCISMSTWLLTQALENNIASNNLSGTSGQRSFDTLEVPAGATQLSFKSSGGSGDVDLYIKYGSAPTESEYDCRPYLSGNTETCNITSAKEGTYHIMLHAYSAYNGVSLLGSYVADSNPGSGTPNSTNDPIALEKGTKVTHLLGTANSETFYVLQLASDATNLKIQTSGGSGDVDMYIRYNTPPTTSVFDCRPYVNGNNETCDVANAKAGNYHVMLHGYSDYANVNIVANYDDSAASPPTPSPVATPAPNPGGTFPLPPSGNVVTLSDLADLAEQHNLTCSNINCFRATSVRELLTRNSSVQMGFLDFFRFDLDSNPEGIRAERARAAQLLGVTLESNPLPG